MSTQQALLKRVEWYRRHLEALKELQFDYCDDGPLARALIKQGLGIPLDKDEWVSEYDRGLLEKAKNG